MGIALCWAGSGGYTMARILVEPSLGEAAAVLREAVGRGDTVVLIAECSVEYEGRGASRLGDGERIIIVKQDGAFLVHRPVGHSPANWQPNTTSIVVEEAGGGIVITATRVKPSREIVRVRVTRVLALYAGRLRDTAEFIMYLDEHEIRDILYENPGLIEPGLRLVEKEKELGEAGYADLYGFDAEGRPVIVEIKRVTAGKEAVHQLLRYIDAYARRYGVRPRGIIVAPALSAQALEAAKRLGLEYKRIDMQRLWRMKKERERRGGRSLLDYLGGDV